MLALQLSAEAVEAGTISDAASALGQLVAQAARFVPTTLPLDDDSEEARERRRWELHMASVALPRCTGDGRSFQPISDATVSSALNLLDRYLCCRPNTTTATTSAAAVAALSVSCKMHEIYTFSLTELQEVMGVSDEMMLPSASVRTAEADMLCALGWEVQAPAPHMLLVPLLTHLRVLEPLPENATDRELQRWQQVAHALVDDCTRLLTLRCLLLPSVRRGSAAVTAAAAVWAMLRASLSRPDVYVSLAEAASGQARVATAFARLPALLERLGLDPAEVQFCSQALLEDEVPELQRSHSPTSVLQGALEREDEHMLGEVSLKRRRQAAEEPIEARTARVKL